MRTSLPLADPALILLDRLAMTRQASPLGAGSIRPTFDRPRADPIDLIDRRLAARSPPTAAP